MTLRQIEIGWTFALFGTALVAWRLLGSAARRPRNGGRRERREKR